MLVTLHKSSVLMSQTLEYMHPIEQQINNAEVCKLPLEENAFFLKIVLFLFLFLLFPQTPPSWLGHMVGL